MIRFLVAAVLLTACASESQHEKQEIEGPVYETYDPFPFLYGCASGDPTSTSVIIWTHVEPKKKDEVKVLAEVSTDPDMKNVIWKKETFSSSKKDHTVKLDVTGLQPYTYYYYRFKAHGKYSEVARTKTLPNDDRDVSIAFVSCSNYAWGYFHAYDALANDSVDLVVHLGDYIYEYGAGQYGTKKIKRDHMPAHELITLDDYRQRYAQYRKEPGLQAVHAQHPFMAEWDDHELANNAYDTGAQNHQENEGDWNKRKQAAIQAYYEWMPIRETKPMHLYRSVDAGERVRVVTLDNRTEGRTVQVDSPQDPHYRDANRHLIGEEQVKWSQQQINAAPSWVVLANPVLFGELRIPGWGHNDLYMDGWDGYPVEKRAWIEGLDTKKRSELVIVTGDYHSSLYLQSGMTVNNKYFSLAPEFVVPSISSSNYDENSPMDSVMVEEGRYKKLNPQLEYVNLHDHGYVRVKFGKREATAQFIYVSSVIETNYTVILGKKFSVKR